MRVDKEAAHIGNHRISSEPVVLRIWFHFDWMIGLNEVNGSLIAMRYLQPLSFAT